MYVCKNDTPMCSPRNRTGTPTEIMEKKAIVTRSPANMFAQSRMVSESTRAKWLTISMGNIKIDSGTRMNRDMLASDGPKKCAA